ncbi:hypothetical protein Q8A67_019082 [Cirrhinus molitorella]|uniref:Uncharacterized protein n=1 Tax=Cirrhinus molitorella TaxID=172907 RepID=A0AA88TG26_9TELE|nr:hypothetical protein Q8A67_019082 [Cirrhinus molitorella]
MTKCLQFKVNHRYPLLSSESALLLSTTSAVCQLWRRTDKDRQVGGTGADEDRPQDLLLVLEIGGRAAANMLSNNIGRLVKSVSFQSGLDGTANVCGALDQIHLCFKSLNCIMRVL